LTVGRDCRRVTYVAGTGFVDRGFGYVHSALGGSHGADFYVTYLTPVGTVNQTTPEAARPECA
jgi:hypothetical protein